MANGWAGQRPTGSCVVAGPWRADGGSVTGASWQVRNEVRWTHGGSSAGRSGAITRACGRIRWRRARSCGGHRGGGGGFVFACCLLEFGLFWVLILFVYTAQTRECVLCLDFHCWRQSKQITAPTVARS